MHRYNNNKSQCGPATLTDQMNYLQHRILFSFGSGAFLESQA